MNTHRESKNIQIKTADPSDINEIYSLILLSKSLLTDDSWCCIDDLAYTMRHIQEEGIIFTAVCEQKIIGFLMLHFPGKQVDNLGRDICLNEDHLSEVVHMDSLAVHPDFRGMHLQKTLLIHGERYLSSTSYLYYMATVHPDNKYSLRNFLDLGYKIVKTTVKYNGYPRHILLKS
jgi:ribosomal protein S18 acetylase RimI-like enzyme